MNFCPYCGNSLPESAKFCANCGAKLENAPVEAEPVAAANPVVAAVSEPVVDQPVYEQPVYEQITAPQPTDSTYGQPAYQQPPYVQPVYQTTYEQPASQQEAPSIAIAIVSLALSCVAVFFDLYAISYISSIAEFYNSSSAFGVGFACSMFSVPCAIVGMIFGNKYLGSNAPRLQPMAKAGKITGIVALGVAGFAMFLGLVVSAS